MCISFENIWIILYWILAGVLSLFYGWKAVDIFFANDAVLPFKKTEKWPRKLHEFWMNFLGSLSGWVGIWILYTTYDSVITVSQIVIALVAFTGMVGRLPTALMIVIYGLQHLGTYLLSLLPVKEKVGNEKKE